MENKKVFFDANVILDILISERKGHANAKKIWKYTVLNGIDIIISEDILTNIFYIAKNKKDTLIFFEHIQTVWEIIPFGKNVIQNAITRSLEKDLDFEDVLQCLCAKENDCHTFITNDKTFYDCSLDIYSAEDFLEKYEN